MESMELNQVLAIQRVLFLASIAFSAATVILFILNFFLSEKVKVNISKQVKKEKISFDDLAMPTLEKKEVGDKKIKETSKSTTKESISLSFDVPEKREEKKEGRKSIFDLKDL